MNSPQKASLLKIIFCFVSFLYGTAFAAESAWDVGAAGHSQVRLISEFDSTADIAALRFGLEFQLKAGWHLYWKNPGEVGFPPRLRWTLPAGWKAANYQFPPPSKILTRGGGTAFGYQNRVIYPVVIDHLSADAPEGLQKFQVHVDYLICDIQCIPESADLEVELSRGVEKKSAYARQLADAFAQIPSPAPEKPDRITTVSEKTVILDLSDLDQKVDDLFTFSMNSNDRLLAEALENGQWKISSTKKLPTFEWTAVWKQLGKKSSVYGIVEAPVESDAVGRDWSVLWLTLLFAFLGGALLNLMPCVLPVVCLKTFALLELRAQGKKSRASLLLTILGILLSFLGLAGVTILFQKAGAQVGWGFQFQNSIFIVCLALLIFFFALNLFDIFHWSLPSSSQSALARAQGPFLEGVFATILATPCSAPFLGTALTYALSESPAVLTVFYLVMGLGLSLPYLVFLIAPGLLRLLPRPGRWMGHLKSFLGYSLLLAVAWLLYVLQEQAGNLAIFTILLCLLGIFICLREIKSKWKWLAVALLCGVSIKAASLFAGAASAKSPSFSQSDLDSRVAKGATLFVVVTADWCLTCKYNEKLIIDSTWFQELLRARQVQIVLIDWTQQNENIANFLKKYGRVGIPFSMLIDRSHHLVLPELLTRGDVEADFEKFFQDGKDSR